MATVETHWRSIIKAVTWRAGGLLMTTGVVYLVTGRAGLAASIGVLDTAVKLGAFYFHERAWLKIRFGRRNVQDFEI
jgi:adenylylsulfate kinase